MSEKANQLPGTVIAHIIIMVLTAFLVQYFVNDTFGLAWSFWRSLLAVVVVRCMQGTTTCRGKGGAS